MASLPLILFLPLILLTEQGNNISNLIHPTAIIHKSASIGSNVSIGPYSVVEEDVIIGNNFGKSCDVNCAVDSKLVSTTIMEMVCQTEW